MGGMNGFDYQHETERLLFRDDTRPLVGYSEEVIRKRVQVLLEIEMRAQAFCLSGCSEELGLICVRCNVIHGGKNGQNNRL